MEFGWRFLGVRSQGGQAVVIDWRAI